MKKEILIRADANTRIGSGHVMRCLALAQTWRGFGGKVTFLSTDKMDNLADRIESEGMELRHLATRTGSAEDAVETGVMADNLDASWVVVDGYQFDGAYQRRIKDQGIRLLCIDDYGHTDRYFADIILNQNIYAKDVCNKLYSHREPYTQLLLSTRYAMLRKEFYEYPDGDTGIGRVRRNARNVLVTLGGGDPENATERIIDAIRRIFLDGLEVIAVAGSENPHGDRLQKAIADMNGASLVRDATRMPELMAWADVAVAAGGSTCWELAYMGLPALVQVLFDNQADIAAGLDAAGVAINLSRFEDLTVERIAGSLTRLIRNADLRREMSRCGRALVDGMGSRRVVEAMLYSNGLVSGSDCKCVSSS